MAPKLSLTNFNRICLLTKSVFNSLKTQVDRLGDCSPERVKWQAEYLKSSLAAELNEFLSQIAPYRNADPLCEDLTPEALAAAMESVRTLAVELQCIVAGYVPVGTPSAPTGIQEPVVVNKSNLMLPKMKLNKFSGSYSDFDQFFSRFETLVDKSPHLTDCEKFEYLLGHLEGTALDVVKHFPFNAENYKAALKVLKDRFSNTRRMISSHANSILNLSKMENNPSSIRYFLDQHSVHFQSLKNIVGSADTHVEDVIYVQFILAKLPTQIRDKFELEVSKVDIPSIDRLLDFLNSYVKAAENATLGITGHADPTPPKGGEIKKKGLNSRIRRNVNKSVSSLSTSLEKSKCDLCNSDQHLISHCQGFLNLQPRARYDAIKQKGLCVRCLTNHNGACNPSAVCSVCSKAHNTLLHFPTESVSLSKQNAKNKSVQSQETSPGSLVSCARLQGLNRTTVLMATALVKLQVSPSQFIVVRAVLDSASHASFVSENVVQTLGCARTANHTVVSGIGQTPTQVKGQCTLSTCTLNGKIISANHAFLILPNITLDTPRECVSSDVFEATRRFVLADPTFHIPSKVDVLLGADIVAASLLGSVTTLGEGMPVVVLTPFGSVLMGNAPVAPHSCAVINERSPSMTNYGHHVYLVGSLVTSIDETLIETVNKFWSVEEPPHAKQLSIDEKLCEDFFLKNTIRLATGRYQTRLPFIENGRNLLGDSYKTAWSRLRALERKFTNDSSFKVLYKDFMADYLAKGHMKLITDPSVARYFIPHHGVYKTHGDSSKIRVVFDASATTSTSYSLNSVLLKAPNVLNLLYDVLTLFRLCRFVFVCDIEQMYRQIMVHEDDMPYQCILWREEATEPVRVYALTTVTYGVGPSAFLAIATLKRLASDERANFPNAAKILLNKIFVDDISAGESTLNDALLLRDELIALLSSGGFVLKKWSSNCSDLIKDLPASHRVDDEMVRVLGLVWDQCSDSLRYPTDELILSTGQNHTKRTVLAQVAKLYDPCGFVSPVVLKAKCFLQGLWRLNLDWDTPLPFNLNCEWIKFQEALINLNQVSVPRLLGISPRVQIHGFCDASQAAYAAVLYLRTQNDQSVEVNIIASKTKVAPLRPVSIPRMELLSAHLLARLFHHYLHLLRMEYTIEDVFLWTDSSIVLDWIRIEPHLLKIFVANRVSEIIGWSEINSWRHVPGVLNPADVASRGVSCPSELPSPLWFSGPPFLQLPAEDWPSLLHSGDYKEADLEYRSAPISLTIATTEDLFVNVSSWSKAVRVATCIVKWRFHKEFVDFPLVHWRKVAIDYLIKHIQITFFSSDIHALENNKQPRAAIQRLNPFLDQAGVLRVRGRLINSTYAKSRCPALLPKHHHLVHLLISHYHNWLGHAGPSQVQFQLSWDYWILSARQVIRKMTHQCVRCFRVAPRPSFPLMGDLPSVRVNPSPPFSHSGMDYCGPFLVKPYSLRKAPMVKVYICIFVCMAIKAVHIEVAHDLSAEAFKDVLKRFIARRGVPSRLYSDCGTNFVGCRTSLDKELKQLLKANAESKTIKEFLLENFVQFENIAPHAPHQGGLWERAVRSTKFHLFRIVGNHTLTLSQLISLTTQIEAILNSRPLTPMSADPGDYSALTPAHFLIGRPISALPQRDWTEYGDGSLKHFQLIQALLQHFWKRWHQEYLITLQARAKWTHKSANLELNDLVVVAEPHCPPLMWPLGRITAVFPGADGVVRKASVSTKAGIFTRPAVKLFRLPVAAED